MAAPRETTGAVMAIFSPRSFSGFPMTPMYLAKCMKPLFALSFDSMARPPAYRRTSNVACRLTTWNFGVSSEIRPKTEPIALTC